MHTPQLIERALVLIRRAKTIDRRKEGFALQWLGWMFAFQGQSSIVLSSVEPTLTALRETGDRWAEAWALLNWANNLSGLQPLKAEEIYKQGMAICRKNGDQNNLGYFCHTRSNLNIMLGRYALAQELADESVRIFEEMESVLGMGYAQQRRGVLATVLGEYEQGIRDLQQALENFEEARTLENVIWTQEELCTTLRLKGDYEKSEKLYRHALEIATTHNYKTRIFYGLFGLGCLAHDQGKLHRGEQFYRDALHAVHDLKLEVWLANVSSYLGRLLVDIGEQRHEEAKQYFSQALMLAMKYQIAPTGLHTFVGVAQLMVKSGDLEQAIQLATLAQQHEASTHETRILARRTLAQIKPTDLVDVEVEDIWTKVQKLLDEFKVDD